MLAGKGKSSYIVYHALKQKYPNISLILEDDEPTSVILKRKIRKSGLGNTIGQILFKIIILPLLKMKGKKRYLEIKEQYALNDSPVYEDQVAIFHVNSVNDLKTIELIRKISPDIIIVNGTRIISRKVLKSTDAIFINMHAGITPKYRGVYGAYWALAENDEEHCGVTVHLVDAGIDTGGIIYQTAIKRTKEDNFFTYPLLQTAEGIKLELQAIEDALNHRLKTQTNNLPSKLWTHPTIAEYLKNYRKGIK